MLNHMTAYLSSRFPEVEIPKPGAPDPDTIIDKGNDGSEWLAGQGQSFWTIVVVIVLAALAIKLLKNPVIRGVLIGVILVGIVFSIMNK